MVGYATPERCGGVVAASGNYFVGKYALCTACRQRPCCCAEVAAAPPAAVVPLRLHSSGKSKTGNAIPFTIWDTVIPRYTLSIYESSVLLYLCRRTIGYGKKDGALFSQRRIADALNISRAAAVRAVDGLAAHGLIVVTPRRSHCTMARLMAHIRVTLPTD